MAQVVENPAPTSTSGEVQIGVSLTRHMVTRNSTALALAGCLGLVELLPVGIGLGLWPSVDLAQTLAIATGINLVLVLFYALIGAVVPRAGSDYVFASRVIPAPFAFAGNFAMTIAVALIVGALAVLASQAVLTPFLLYSATEFQNSSLATFALTLSQPQGAIITATVLVVLAFFVSISSPAANSRYLFILLVLALAGWAAILFQLITANPANFAGRWDAVLGEGSYASQINSARALSLMFSDPPSIVLLAGIPLGFLIFLGARLPSAQAGEIKGSVARSQLWSGWLAVLICSVLTVGSYMLLSKSISTDWLAAESHLFLYNNSLETPAMPWLPFYAALLQPVYPFFVLSTVGILAGLIAALQAFLRAFSRITFAWAKDNLLIDLGAYVHANTRSPLIATLIFTILVQIGVAVAASLGVMRTLNSSMFALVCLQVIPALAAIFYPLARRRWVKAGYEGNQKISAALVVISGLLVLGILAWMIAVSFIYPAQGSAIGMIDLIVLGSGFVLGLILFYWRAIDQRRQGVNLFTRYKNIPEE